MDRWAGAAVAAWPTLLQEVGEFVDERAEVGERGVNRLGARHVDAGVAEQVERVRQGVWKEIEEFLGVKAA